MKVLFYVLSALFGLFGLLAALRFAELLLNGRIMLVQLLLALGGLGIAWVFLTKARSK